MAINNHERVGKAMDLVAAGFCSIHEGQDCRSAASDRKRSSLT
jgi:hypothetical protein